METKYLWIKDNSPFYTVIKELPIKCASAVITLFPSVKLTYQSGNIFQISRSSRGVFTTVSGRGTVNNNYGFLTKITRSSRSRKYTCKTYTRATMIHFSCKI